MSDIFLSYKSENRAQAKIIVETIEQYGYSVWWDRIIPPGKTFDQVIEGLDAAKCVVVLWSKESVSSDWVKNEVREGTRRRILVPVLIDNAKIPFEFRHIQAAQLIDWHGEMPNPEFELLLRSIGEIVGRPQVLIKKAEQKLKVPDEMEKVPEFIEKKKDQNSIPSEIDPKWNWKWGSMIVSLLLLTISWYYTWMEAVIHTDPSSRDKWVTLLLIGCPLVIYLMYKERKPNIKYGIAWIIVPILLMLIGMSFYYDKYYYNDVVFFSFLFLAVPAIIIDIYAMHKIYGKQI